MIAEVILFTREIFTLEAVLAIFASIARDTILTVITFETIETMKTFRTVHDLIVLFTVIDISRVHTVLREFDRITIEAIFILIGIESEVTILLIGCLIDVVAVFAEAIVGEIKLGYVTHQFAKLFSERSREIEFSAICFGISFVRSSDREVIDFQILVRTVHRDDIFARKVTLSLVEFSLIAEA